MSLKPTEQLAIAGSLLGVVATVTAVCYGRASEKQKQEMDKRSEQITGKILGSSNSSSQISEASNDQ